MVIFINHVIQIVCGMYHKIQSFLGEYDVLDAWKHTGNDVDKPSPLHEYAVSPTHHHPTSVASMSSSIAANAAS
jgi:hypothetical protein